jgi:RNA polymerase primary sigma factor
MADMLSSDDDDTRTDKRADEESMNYDIDSILNQVLRPREISIIKKSFGIGCSQQGLEEIGESYGLSRERVRQIREKSIMKIRNSGYAKILTKYLG